MSPAKASVAPTERERKRRSRKITLMSSYLRHPLFKEPDFRRLAFFKVAIAVHTLRNERAVRRGAGGQSHEDFTDALARGTFAASYTEIAHLTQVDKKTVIIETQRMISVGLLEKVARGNGAGSDDSGEHRYTEWDVRANLWRMPNWTVGLLDMALWMAQNGRKVR